MQKTLIWISMDNQTCFCDEIISYTCDLCLELEPLSLVNINTFPNGLQIFFPLQLCFLEFQDFEIFIWFDFSSSSPNEHVNKKKHAFVVQKAWNQLYDLMHFFSLPFHKNI
jgi:hypothetical protein